MKKIITTIMILCLTFICSINLFACGNKAEQYYGTWNSVSAKIDGLTYTIEELEQLGDYTLSDFSIEINDDGKAYIYSQGQGNYVKWELTRKGIKIGERECFLEKELLSITNNGITIYLSK